MENLSKFDCIVLAGDMSLYDLGAIQERARSVVDLRNADPSNYAVSAESDVAAGSTRPISAVYTGVVPIVYKAQRSLLESLIQSTFWSFVTITPLMMLVSRSFGAGLVAMLPNVLPVFVIFGAMGWMNIQVDIGSMMTASIALGVAVDDTIHYLSWYRIEIDKGLARPAAILNTYKRCATPTFQAATISGLGLSIFAFSTFTPTQRFGYLMLTILFMGVVAELIFFPALLAGPLGRVFRPRKTPVQATVDDGFNEAVVYSLEEERSDRPHSGVAAPRLGTPRVGERGTGTRDR
jgi:predicted RND superfamily exporter protein